ncbi:MAG TPA: glycine betaine/L-proline ABC transporter substrate-binding protein ProX [Desulfuromonadales bacterium]|nr:glycine betaine/L-proline ABC transporter substrate-binding protein ProX [Desulfuromonadales bacterium]
MLKKLLLSAALLLLAIPPAYAGSYEHPGEGVVVKPARATWDTGFFQEALVRKGLEALGYTVKFPVELQNQLFYQALALGDVDYWTNGWFPMHREQMPKNFFDKGEIIGYVVKAGGLQGYLVSKKAVEKYHIKSLDDFKRLEVRKAFDANGDGKADLVGCPPGWGCADTISHHMKVYGLQKDINVIKAGYTASMADAIARFKNGRPIFFFTWAPNWTIFKLKPGRDVMWINVPEIKPRAVEKGAADRMTATGVKGAVSDPIKLGFVDADIRIVANKTFLAANPAAKRFFQLFKLPLEDINAQNARMHEGENSQQDIEHQADEWIAAHRATWNHWLDQARKAAQASR